MCTFSYPFGIQDILPCGSCLAFELNENGEANKLLFSWEFPPKEFDEISSETPVKF